MRISPLCHSRAPFGARGIFRRVKGSRAREGIADTGFLVAFANANDKHHAWAVQIAADITEPLLTCEAVLAETAFHLESTSVVLAMLNEGLVTLSFDCRRASRSACPTRRPLRRSKAGPCGFVPGANERAFPEAFRDYYRPRRLSNLPSQQARSDSDSVPTRALSAAKAGVSIEPGDWTHLRTGIDDRVIDRGVVVCNGRPAFFRRTRRFPSCRLPKLWREQPTGRVFAALAERRERYTLKRKRMTSPSRTTYSFPSSLSLPASFAPASPRAAR